MIEFGASGMIDGWIYSDIYIYMLCYGDQIICSDHTTPMIWPTKIIQILHKSRGVQSSETVANIFQER